MIYPCTCTHPDQDKMYGKGKRVWNALGFMGKSGIRCTVCGKEDKTVIAKIEKEDKKKGGKK